MRKPHVTDDETHPAADIDAVVVDPEDVAELLHREHTESDPLRSHVFRIAPPLEGDVRAEPHVQDGPVRHQGQAPQPIHLPPATFVANESGDHPNETHLEPPTEGPDEEWRSAVEEALISPVRVSFDDRTGNEVWVTARYESGDS